MFKVQKNKIKNFYLKIKTSRQAFQTVKGRISDVRQTDEKDFQISFCFENVPEQPCLSSVTCQRTYSEECCCSTVSESELWSNLPSDFWQQVC